MNLKMNFFLIIFFVFKNKFFFYVFLLCLQFNYYFITWEFGFEFGIEMKNF